MSVHDNRASFVEDVVEDFTATVAGVQAAVNATPEELDALAAKARAAAASADTIKDEPEVVETATGTELVVRFTINPLTGERVELDVVNGGTTDVIAERRHEVNEAKLALDLYRQDLDEELNVRLDRANTRSAEVGGWRLETKAPSTTEYPEEPLREALELLVAEGKLDAEVIDTVLVPQPRPAPKLNRTELNKLLRHTDPDVVELVKDVGVDKPQNRPVTVKPIQEKTR